ncbi:unnamed protein product [Cunninghamella blakesleeana]
MVSLPLAPIGKPSRWYSKRNYALEECNNLKLMETEYDHEREKVLQFQCSMAFVGPKATTNNINDNSNDTNLQDHTYRDDINISTSNNITNEFNGFGNIDHDSNSLDRSHISPTYSPEPSFAFRSLVQSPSDRFEIGNSFISNRASSTPINTASSTRLPNLFSSPPDISDDFLHSPFMRSHHRNNNNNNGNTLDRLLLFNEEIDEEEVDIVDDDAIVMDD